METSRILKPVDDTPVWSITCFYIAALHRKKGASVYLLKAASQFVKNSDGGVLEGYPVEPDRPNLIGSADDLNKGYGETMMRLALQRCFADPAVTAIVIDPLSSNVWAHRFYQRLGFVPEGRRMFDDDDCLVHRLTRPAWCECLPTDEVSVHALRDVK